MTMQFTLRAFGLVAIVVMTGTVCLGNGPQQHAIQKHSVQKCGKCCDPPLHPFWDFWHHCKPHDPPYLPIVQSQAFQLSSPLTDASQMRLQIEKDQVAPGPGQSNQENGNGGRGGGGPMQKIGPAQKAAYHTDGIGSFEERVDRLERRVELLLGRIDEIIERDSGKPRWDERNAELPLGDDATRTR